ncbi:MULTISPECIES: M16 family metallopeptidase [Aphanothece]|uniref:M16 family metallopeptidase n=1 Tax=Aphanothece TaxID=1121 RepID=UPI00398527C4
MTSWLQHTLPGGLVLVQQHRPGVGLVAARLWLRGGSSRDPQGGRGAMQLLAGLMTRGCGQLDAEQLADLVEGRGAALRSEAHEDALVISLKCATEDAPDLLPLLLAMARQPSLEADQLELERQLNLQSLQRQQEDPFQLAHDQLRHQLYGDGPYGHDPLGVEAELEALDVGTLHPLLQQLGDEGALLVICGDIPGDGSLMAALVDQLVQTPWTTALPQRHAGAPGLPGPSLALHPQDTEQVVLLLGSATVPLGDPDALPLRLLQAHLGMGMSSRLFVLLREERGLAYDVGVHMPARCGATPFVWHLSTSAERAMEATRCLLEEWERLLEEPLETDALTMAKAKFRGQDAMGRQTCGQIADRQALVLGHGLGEDYVARTLELAETVTPEQLLAAARRHLPRPRLSLCGPQDALAQAAAIWEKRAPALQS